MRELLLTAAFVGVDPVKTGLQISEANYDFQLKGRPRMGILDEPHRGLMLWEGATMQRHVFKHKLNLYGSRNMCFWKLMYMIIRILTEPSRCDPRVSAFDMQRTVYEQPTPVSMQWRQAHGNSIDCEFDDSTLLCFQFIPAEQSFGAHRGNRHRPATTNRHRQRQMKCFRNHCIQHAGVFCGVISPSTKDALVL